MHRLTAETLKALSNAVPATCIEEDAQSVSSFATLNTQYSHFHQRRKERFDLHPNEMTALMKVARVWGLWRDGRSNGRRLCCHGPNTFVFEADQSTLVTCWTIKADHVLDAFLMPLRNGDTEAVAWLLCRTPLDVNHVWSINCGRSRGYTMLHHAAYNGQPELCSFLLERGADPSVINRHGETPEQAALSVSNAVERFYTEERKHRCQQAADILANARIQAENDEI